MRRFLPVLALLVGCAFSSKFRPTPGAPPLQPSSSVAVVAEPPQGATRLGTVTARGNNSQGGAGCESQAAFEAKKAGATHVVVRPAKTPWYAAGQIRCEGVAYYLAPK